MEDWSNRDRDHIWHPFAPLDGSPQVMITSASGVYLHTSSGKAIIDAVSSWWVNLHGHSHPAIAEAISSQAGKLEHVIFAGFTHEPAITLAERLSPLLPGPPERLFFSDDGSTAVEVALKMAIQYWHHLGVERPKVIALEGAYHGDTFGAMSVGERGLFTSPWTPYLFDVSFIPFPGPGKEEVAINAFSDLVSKNKSSIFIFEPLIQAAAGMRMYAPEVLDRLMQIAQANRVVTIADEVFTGFGRTGKLFACDHLKHQPDLVTISKGLTGGALPLGITACTSKITGAFRSTDLGKTFFHGHSFTGNPLSCAAANASLTLTLKSDCSAAIGRISRFHLHFQERIISHPMIKDVRCRGTVIALELKTNESTGYQNKLRESIYSFFLARNILLRPLGNVLYIVPPYVITDIELESIYKAIEEFLELL